MQYLVVGWSMLFTWPLTCPTHWSKCASPFQHSHLSVNWYCIYIYHHRNDLLWFTYDDTQDWWCRLCIIVHSCNSPVNACHLTKYWFLRNSKLANSGSRLWMQSSSLQLQLDACTCIHLKYQTPWQCMHAQAWCGSVNWKTLTRLNPARCNCN